jgi:hypothetical protein
MLEFVAIIPFQSRVRFLDQPAQKKIGIWKFLE